MNFIKRNYCKVSIAIYLVLLTAYLLTGTPGTSVIQAASIGVLIAVIAKAGHKLNMFLNEFEEIKAEVNDRKSL